MSRSLRFRFARREDLPTIVKLLTDDTLGERREVADLEVYQKAFADMESEGDNHYLLALGDDDMILGCLQLTLISGLSRSGTKRAQIEGVRVAESARGQGVGKQMMEEAHAIARKRGCGLAQLTTDTTRKGALEFYQNLGYEASHHGMKCTL